MKISFERTGGFAGMRMAITVDLDSLPGPEAATLRKMVTDADFFNLAEIRTGQAIPDGFQYALTIEGDGKHRTIQVAEASIPDELRPLLNDLSLRARRQPRV
jgi:hypothetical protein